MKLTITKKPFKGRAVGSQYEAGERQAKLLVKLGRAAYMTRDLVAVPAEPVRVQKPSAAQFVIKIDGDDVALDGMDAAALHELAKELGVKVHHASGAEKVRAALIESQNAAE